MKRPNRDITIVTANYNNRACMASNSCGQGGGNGGNGGSCSGGGVNQPGGNGQ